uniref:C-type lectin domain-containing protein n=1 Tax=Hucho hucho TaxID=62062 RepID=A0A4W5PLW3_9TELE
LIHFVLTWLTRQKKLNIIRSRCTIFPISNISLLMNENGTEGRSACPSGWSKYGSRCFRYISTERTWAESEQFCVYQGANLASVHSTAEYHFIQEMVMIQTGGLPHAWIGGYDLAQEGLWLCSDGSRFEFTNWSKGQPDNYQGKQNCLYFNYGAEKRWDDGICSARFPSVCSRRM